LWCFNYLSRFHINLKAKKKSGYVSSLLTNRGARKAMTSPGSPIIGQLGNVKSHNNNNNNP